MSAEGKTWDHMSPEERAAFDRSLRNAHRKRYRFRQVYPQYEFSEELGKTVQTTAEGERYVVELRDGKMVRVAQLPSVRDRPQEGK